jgi:hypothetical protein
VQMGAGCALMWAVHARLTGRDHHMSKMVLLSPGGFHLKVAATGVHFCLSFPFGTLPATAYAPRPSRAA